MGLDVADLTIAKASTLIKRKKISPVELVTSTLERIEKLEPIFHTYITLTPEAALREAKQAEKEILEGSYRGPLHGIPMSLKDVIYTEGVRTTVGSRVFANFVPSYDATIVTKLKTAGAITLGKNNMHELALGTTNANPYYGIVPNPWNRSHIPGGSSGGDLPPIVVPQVMRHW